MEIDIQHDLRSITRGLTHLQRQAIPRATVRALNKTGTTVRKVASQQIREETKLPAGFIKRKLEPSKARRGKLSWSMAALRATTNLIEWVSAAKRTPRAFRKKPGVISKAWGRNRTYKGAFIGSAKNSGKQLVYARKGAARYPIKALHGPSVRAVFVRILRGLGPVARQRFSTTFKQEMDYEVRKLRGDL